MGLLNEVLRFVVAGIMLLTVISPLVLLLTYALESLVSEEFLFRDHIVGFTNSVVACVLCIYLMYPVYETRTVEYPIYAIEDSSRVQGRGSRRSFYIEEQDRYYYMADYKNGKKMYWCPTSKSYIVESNETKPKIKITYERDKPKNEFYKWLKNGYVMERNHEYEITVPKDTVSDSFNIDLN